MSAVKYVPSVMAGSVMYSSHAMRPRTFPAASISSAGRKPMARLLVGKSPNWTDSTSTSMMPSQKFGVLMPPSEKTVAA